MDLHGEAGGIVQAIPGGIGGRAAEDRECDVGTLRRRLRCGNYIIRRRRWCCLRSGFAYGTRGTGIDAAGREAEAGTAQQTGKQQDTHLETERRRSFSSGNGSGSGSTWHRQIDRQTGRQAGGQVGSSGEDYVVECGTRVAVSVCLCMCLCVCVCELFVCLSIWLMAVWQRSVCNRTMQRCN